jgi:hypothetical protein
MRIDPLDQVNAIRATALFIKRNLATPFVERSIHRENDQVFRGDET